MTTMTEADKIPLAARDRVFSYVGLEKDISGIEVAQTDLPPTCADRQQHAAAAVEIEAHAAGSLLRRNCGRR